MYRNVLIPSNRRAESMWKHPPSVLDVPGAKHPACRHWAAEPENAKYSNKYK